MSDRICYNGIKASVILPLGSKLKHNSLTSTFYNFVKSAHISQWFHVGDIASQINNNSTVFQQLTLPIDKETLAQPTLLSGSLLAHFDDWWIHRQMVGNVDSFFT